MSRRVLYITIDGILSHLGFSQVVRVVEGLAERGREYVIVSLERDHDLRDERRLAWLHARLAERGIEWHWSRYLPAGKAYPVRNQWRLAALARRAVRRYGVSLVHARAYHGAAVAVGLGRPWIFDARGYWIDERIEEGRWFTTPTRLAVARALERTLYARADHVVTLTELHADDLRTGRHGPSAKNVTVIPTCADYDDFRPCEARPDGPLRVGIVGSINRAYLVGDTARLAAEIARSQPSAEFRVVSADHAGWRSALESAGVPGEAIRADRAPHESMPARLREMDWLLLLLTPETKAKRAMMPTKLAECFASGVRVCAHGCNSEVEAAVRSAEAGVVLAGVTHEALLGGVARIAPPKREEQLRTRELTRGHFSLESAITRYHQLLG